MTWFTVLICFLASAAAGVGTGFAGMSAAAVIAPMLSVFLGIPIYDAIGIGLASDVIASAISAYNYKKRGNLDIKNSLVLLVTVLAMTVVGSFASSFMPETAMSGTAQVAMIFIGLKFLIKPVTTPKEKLGEQTVRQRVTKAMIGGIFIGFICGFVGAGGGMMMLFVLTSFLGYSIHMAVGTSVFIMAFTAFTGGVSHFVIGGLPDLTCLLLCIVFTFVWAQIASNIANRSKPVVLNRVVGCVLILTSAIILGVNLFN